MRNSSAYSYKYAIIIITKISVPLIENFRNFCWLGKFPENQYPQDSRSTFICLALIIILVFWGYVYQQIRTPAMTKKAGDIFVRSWCSENTKFLSEGFLLIRKLNLVRNIKINKDSFFIFGTIYAPRGEWGFVLLSIRKNMVKFGCVLDWQEVKYQQGFLIVMSNWWIIECTKIHSKAAFCVCFLHETGKS